MLELTEDQRRQYLKDEYFFLQNTYEDFDKRILTIKGWAVTSCLAGIGLGFQNTSPQLWVVSGAGALMFWLVEARWKTFQYAYGYRIRQIEGYFRGDEDKHDLVPLQIYNSWFNAYAYDARPHASQASERRRSLLRRTATYAWLPFVRTPYLQIVIADLIVLGLWSGGVLLPSASGH
jgi:hypothetical protein